ncbi:uncharacterized protein [Gorilla gorilla gorilla]|uniref:uncharacterized protein isoform X1 n=1 Tax=Gorilla gorilla gorilla TaxID=9595 RepID=UPI0008F4C901|nr:uncharacterized protein LOC101138261 isoform X1 [Gorilla gorilla gorilla]
MAPPWAGGERRGPGTTCLHSPWMLEAAPLWAGGEGRELGAACLHSLRMLEAGGSEAATARGDFGAASYSDLAFRCASSQNPRSLEPVASSPERRRRQPSRAFACTLPGCWRLEAVRQQQREATLERPHIATSPSAARPPRAQEARNLWHPSLKGGDGNPAEGESGSLGCRRRRKDKQESRPPGENFTKFSDYLVIILLCRLLF